MLWNDVPGVVHRLCFLLSNCPCDHLVLLSDALSRLIVSWLTCQCGEWIHNLGLIQHFIKEYYLYTYHLVSSLWIQRNLKGMWMLVSTPKMLKDMWVNPGLIFLLLYWKSNDLSHFYRQSCTLCIEEKWINVSHSQKHCLYFKLNLGLKSRKEVLD